MKKHLLIPAILLMLVGCKKEKECNSCDCNNDGYAPAESALSWVDYNSPEAFIQYFYHCHYRTAQENSNKTVKLRGFLIPHNNGSYLAELGVLGTVIRLCNSPNGDGESVGSLIYNDTAYTNHITDLVGKELFFTGKTDYKQTTYPPECCKYVIFVRQTTLDSIGDAQ